jgi:hypothetical protein
MLLVAVAASDDTARLHARVAGVMDAATGTVRGKKKEDAEEMALCTRTARTVRTRK